VKGGKLKIRMIGKEAQQILEQCAQKRFLIELFDRASRLPPSWGWVVANCPEMVQGTPVGFACATLIHYLRKKHSSADQRREGESQ